MRITSLTLQTQDLKAITAHYRNTLGFALISADGAHSTFQIGWSKLTWKQSSYTPQAQYHVALGIPVNNIAAGRDWLSQRARLLGARNGDLQFWFEGWQAHAVYWRDPAGNILELISPYDASQPVDQTPLSTGRVLGVSEIGLPAQDVPTFVAQLQETTGIQPFGEVNENFVAMGPDVYGRLIVVKTGRLWYPDLITPALPQPTIVEVDGQRINIAERTTISSDSTSSNL